LRTCVFCNKKFQSAGKICPECQGIFGEMEVNNDKKVNQRTSREN